MTAILGPAPAFYSASIGLLYFLYKCSFVQI